MTAENEKELTEQQLKQIKREMLRVKLLTAWQIVRVVSFPIVIVAGVVFAVVFGALFAVLAESFRKITD